jgi:hypothetical protein
MTGITPGMRFEYVEGTDSADPWPVGADVCTEADEAEAARLTAAWRADDPRVFLATQDEATIVLWDPDPTGSAVIAHAARLAEEAKAIASAPDTFRTAGPTGWRTVRGEIVGDFGVSRHPAQPTHKRWTVTHLASGRATGRWRTRRMALSFARALQALPVNWTNARLNYAELPAIGVLMHAIALEGEIARRGRAGEIANATSNRG